MKKTCTILLVAALVLSLCACGKEADTALDSAAVINGKLLVSLESNPSTGFAWKCSAIDGDCLTQEGEKEYSSSNSDPMITGAGGVEKFSFVPVNDGSATLHFEYLRSFEENSTIRTFDVSVKVSGGKISILKQDFVNGDTA